jgi:hypothetical protein
MTDPFELLSNFDWLTPAWGIAETILRGPFAGHTFYISLDSGWSGAQCERILGDAGISVYARCIAEGDAFFTVSNDQAEQAERLLLRAGAPLKYHLFSERNRQYLGGGK